MNTKYFVAAAALALLPVTAPAMAQDVGDSFTGPYVGGQIGWGQRSIDEDFGIPGVAAFDRDRSSFDYGAYFGFDAPVGTGFVLGGEAEIGAGGRTLRQTLAPGITAAVNPDWNYMFSGRAGFVAGDRALVYGRVGYGAERIQVSVTDSVTPANSFSDKDWADGAVYGAGVEYALSPSTSARVEYRYKDFDGSYNPQQVLAGISFRF
ncbi:outer membrane protein [Sphingoaurantiacus capsulatus]|uniref:Outer membrane protein n=1 Tax=Sphingoaurantiacus capsulatus TaxID=1771310 RepID=A0ABV7X9S7_9SPHN